MRVMTRRFFCATGDCRRRIFAERLGDNVLPLRSRRTARLEHLVHHLGLALGGRPAANFAKRLTLPVSNDPLLRVVPRRTSPRTDPLTVVGVDDWAMRRNHRYGTIVCDLERRKILTLLPQRWTEAMWGNLEEQVGIPRGADGGQTIDEDVPAEPVAGATGISIELSVLMADQRE